MLLLLFSRACVFTQALFLFVIVEVSINLLYKITKVRSMTTPIINATHDYCRPRVISNKSAR